MTDSLPERMRGAADTLDDASRWKQLNDDSKVPWTAFQLRYTADRIEAEMVKEAESAALTEELCREILRGVLSEVANESLRDSAGNTARRLIAAGWTKQATE